MQRAKLRVAEGFITQKNWDLPDEGELSIGRDRRKDIPIMSRRVSRDHAKITIKKGAVSIQDLGSKTGILVNNRKVTQTVLRPNDLVKIGDIIFRYLIEEDSEEQEDKPVIATPVVMTPQTSVETEDQSSESLPPASEVSAPIFSDEEAAIVGRTLAGIRIIAPLTKGRRALIYKGTHAGRNRIVAFKILNADAAKDPDVIRWFVNGVKKAAELKHEDTLVPLGGGRADEFLYCFTPFMESGSAKDCFGRAKKDGLPSVKRALEALVHVARALEYAQTQNVLHLGLRPSKMLFDEKLRPKLLGLGFDNGATAPGAETTSEVAAYLAPEQVSGSPETSTATDVFGLGATFYYMLTGKRPSRDHRQRIPSPKQSNGLVPDSICRIIEKMLAPEAAQRYPTYGQLIHDVRWALRGEAWPHV